MMRHFNAVCVCYCVTLLSIVHMYAIAKSDNFAFVPGQECVIACACTLRKTTSGTAPSVALPYDMQAMHTKGLDAAIPTYASREPQSFMRLGLD